MDGWMDGWREGGREGRLTYLRIDSVYACAHPTHACHHQHDRALLWGVGKRG